MARTDPRPNYGRKRRINSTGYVDIYQPDHPIARRDGYVLEHRKVAWDAGLFTDPSLRVHHRNRDRRDNRPENLEVMTHDEHMRLHRREDGVRNQFGSWSVSSTEREKRIRDRDWMRAKRRKVRGGQPVYRFGWGNNAKRKTLKGRCCRVVSRGSMSSVEVEFLDNGQREIVSFRALRKTDAVLS